MRGVVCVCVWCGVCVCWQRNHWPHLIALLAFLFFPSLTINQYCAACYLLVTCDFTTPYAVGCSVVGSLIISVSHLM